MAGRQERHQPEQTNTSLQRRMAEILLSSGVDEAIEFAILNGWQGVLNELYSIVASPRTGGPGSRNAKT